jgi:hypothetical protein
MNDFEKPFRDALTDLEATPPAGGWPPIEAVLDRKGFDYRMYGLLLLLLLLVGAGSFVSYHVATHAMEQQRAPTAMQQAVSSEATLSAASVMGDHIDEVPCDRMVSEIACTPQVDTGDNDLAQQHPVVQSQDDPAPVVIGAARNRVIRRNRKGETPTEAQPSTRIVLSGQTRADASSTHQRARASSVTVRDHDDQRLGQQGETARTLRKQKNEGGQEDKEGVALLAGNTDRRRTAIHGKSEITRGREGVGRGEVIESDSAIYGLNGPPMPFRKRTTPQSELLALTPLDKLKRIPVSKKKANVLKSDSIGEKKRAERTLSKWSIQLQGGANYTFKKMDPAKDLYYVTGLNNKNQVSWRNTGYQLSATARYPLARRTTLMTGISWNMLREHTEYNYYNIIADSVEVQHIADKSIEVNAYSKVRRNDVTNTLHYLGVQVGVIQHVTFLRHERNILLALHVNRQVAATNRTLRAGHRFTVNDMRIALRAGMENRFALSRHHTLTLTPFLEQSFGSVYSEESVYTLRPIQVGLDVGLVLPVYKRR